MKLLIASDIHGSAFYCKKLIEIFKSEKADRMLLLGDILYHGPRNDLPDEYSPKKVIEMLNCIKEKIYCVRGDCDSEVDQMVLNFPILSDYSVIPLENRAIYATHGHKYNCDNPPPLCEGDILLNGHTHIPKCTVLKDFVYMNPGSVSIPKEDSPHSYMTLEDGVFLWKNLNNGEVYLKYE